MAPPRRHRRHICDSPQGQAGLPTAHRGAARGEEHEEPDLDAAVGDEPRVGDVLLREPCAAAQLRARDLPTPW
jgi:hypothetical protein